MYTLGGSTELDVEYGKNTVKATQPYNMASHLKVTAYIPVPARRWIDRLWESYKTTVDGLQAVNDCSKQHRYITKRTIGGAELGRTLTLFVGFP